MIALTLPLRNAAGRARYRAFVVPRLVATLRSGRGYLSMRDEMLSHWIYEHALCHEDQPPGPAVLLQRIVGGNRVRFTDALGVEVEMARPSGWTVTIPRSAKDSDVCVSMGRALAAIASLSQSPPEILHRSEIQPVAAAILMPRIAVQRTVARWGPRVELIAKAFVVPRLVASTRLRRLGIGLASGQFARHVGRRTT